MTGNVQVAAGDLNRPPGSGYPRRAPAILVALATGRCGAAGCYQPKRLYRHTRRSTSARRTWLLKRKMVSRLSSLSPRALLACGGFFSVLAVVVGWVAVKWREARKEEHIADNGVEKAKIEAKKERDSKHTDQATLLKAQGQVDQAGTYEVIAGQARVAATQHSERPKAREPTKPKARKCGRSKKLPRDS